MKDRFVVHFGVITMRISCLALAAAGAAFLAASPAAAFDYPYCLQGRQTGIPGECSYRTYQQCQAAASGRSAFCNINPRFAFRQQNGERRYDRRRYRDGYY